LNQETHTKTNLKSSQSFSGGGGSSPPGPTSIAGTVYHFRAPEFTFDFVGVRVNHLVVQLHVFTSLIHVVMSSITDHSTTSAK
jgi:hypothetical protein